MTYPDTNKKYRNKLARQGITQRVTYRVIYVWAHTGEVIVLYA